jgi:hypothetical protein
MHARRLLAERRDLSDGADALADADADLGGI